jgi:hypothetical protein
MCIRFGDNLLEKSLKNKHLSNSNRCFFIELFEYDFDSTSYVLSQIVPLFSFQCL